MSPRGTGNPIKPDIVVQKRGDNSQNLLVVEAKKHKRASGISPKDFSTLSWLTEPSYEDRDDFGYDFGLFIEFIGIDRLELTWFSRGEASDSRSLTAIANDEGLYTYSAI